MAAAAGHWGNSLNLVGEGRTLIAEKAAPLSMSTDEDPVICSPPTTRR